MGEIVVNVALFFTIIFGILFLVSSFLQEGQKKVESSLHAIVSFLAAIIISVVL